jgi:hypothetical protein
MPFGNFGELKTAIQTRLGRTDLTGQIPDFISLAHRKIIRGDQNPVQPGISVPALRIVEMETSASLVTVAGEVSLPSDYLQVASDPEISASDSMALTYRSPSKFKNLQAQDVAGTPFYYTIDGGKLKTAPITSVTVLFDYYADVDEMTGDSSVNTILSVAPDAYFYGALVEAYQYIRQEQRAMLYRGQFANVVINANIKSNMGEEGGLVTMIPDNVI